MMMRMRMMIIRVFCLVSVEVIGYEMWYYISGLSVGFHSVSAFDRVPLDRPTIGSRGPHLCVSVKYHTSCRNSHRKIV